VAGFNRPAAKHGSKYSQERSSMAYATDHDRDCIARLDDLCA